MNKYFVLLFIIISIGTAGRLVINGDFEQPLNIGWTSAVGLQNTLDTIDRQTYFDLDPDYEVRVKKYDETYAKLSQVINIPTTDLQFSINAKILAYEYSPGSGYWATAAIVLRYINQNGNLLGETRIFHKTTSCPWTNSSMVHLIEITNPNNWFNQAFNINQELDNLPGVNRTDIKNIEIALLDTTNGC